MSMARSMLKAKNLSNVFKGATVASAIYILNWSPTRNLKEKVLQEAWTSMKSSVSHFKIFGCVANAHIPEKLRQKLDDGSEKCIFVGYSE